MVEVAGEAVLAIVRGAVSVLCLFAIGRGLSLSVPAVGMVPSVVAVVSMVRIVSAVRVVAVHSAHEWLAVIRAIDMVGIMRLILVNAVQLLVDVGHPGVVRVVAPVVVIVASLHRVVHIVLLILLAGLFHLIGLVSLVVVAVVVNHEITMGGAQTRIWVSHVMSVPTWNIEAISSCILIIAFSGGRVLRCCVVLSNVIASLFLVVAPALVISQVAPAFSAGLSVLKRLLWIVNAIALFLLVVASALVIGEVAPALAAS